MLEKFRHYRERIKEGMLRDMWRQTLWIYEYARLYWKQMIFYTLLGLAGTLVSLISSLISRDMVDIITGQQAGLLARTFCLYIGFSVGNVLISQISNYFANKISISVDNAIKADIFEKMLLTDLESIQNYHTGDLLTRWSSERPLKEGSFFRNFSNALIKDAVIRFMSSSSFPINLTSAFMAIR